jgi:plastocyanin
MSAVELEVGDTVRWPGTKSFTATIIAIDRVPPEPVAWISRRDDLGDYHHHTAALKELRFAP